MRYALLLVLTGLVSAQITTPDEVFEKLYRDKVPLGQWADAPPEEVDVELCDLDPLFKRYLELRAAYRKAPNQDKPLLTPSLNELMDSIIAVVRSLPAAGPAAWDFFAPYAREDMFVLGRGTLWVKLDQLRTTYVQTGLAHAHGKEDLEALLEDLSDRELLEGALEVQRVLAKLEEVRQAGSRRRARKNACAVRTKVSDYLAELGSSSAKELGDLVSWMERKAWVADAARTRMDQVVAALGLRERYSQPLRARLDAIDKRAYTDDKLEELQASYDKKLSKETLAIVKTLARLARDCEKVDEHGLASVLHELVLVLDDSNQHSRQALGFEQVAEQWLRPHAARMAEQGFVWSCYGWAEQSQLLRLDAGEVCDAGTWKKVAAADKEHSTLASPWMLSSDAFALTSTAGIELSAELLVRLDAFLLLLQRQLDGLFQWQQSTPKGPDRPFAVRLYKDAKQRAKVLPDARGPALLDADNVLHLCLQDGAIPHRALQRQLTQQILAETLETAPAPWLTEGAAMYLEPAVFFAGRMSLGSARRNPRIIAHAQTVGAGSPALALDQLVTLSSQERWQAGDTAAQEEAAAASFAFLMVMDSGRYRADLIAMLGDPTLRAEEAFGLTGDSLAVLARRYFQGLAAH